MESKNKPTSKIFYINLVTYDLLHKKAKELDVKPQFLFRKIINEQTQVFLKNLKKIKIISKNIFEFENQIYDGNTLDEKTRFYLKMKDCDFARLFKIQVALKITKSKFAEAVLNNYLKRVIALDDLADKTT